MRAHFDIGPTVSSRLFVMTVTYVVGFVPGPVGRARRIKLHWARREQWREAVS